MHALIIEDESLIAELIELRLRELGFTSFAWAMDEEEAVAAAAVRCPDLITSDVNLAEGCGIDAVLRICEGKQTAVLYITGSAAIVRDRCPSASILEKPFTVDGLRAGVAAARLAT